MIRFVLVTLSLFALTKPASAANQVALQIYFNDGFAFTRQSEDLFQEMFKDLRPDLTYRLISISTEELENQEYKQRISSALRPGEELRVLIIDTHGNSERSESGAWLTVLRHLGAVGEQEPNAEFRQTFDALKNRATPDLQIILNSCSVFCGGEVEASKRAKAFLDYFGAPNGSIYGSDVNEVTHAFDDPKYFKGRYLLPDLKMVTTVVALVTALFFPVVGYEEYMAVMENQTPLLHAWTNAVFKSLGVGAGVTAAYAGGVPLVQKLLSKFVLNRGFYFRFREGKLLSSQRLIKQRDLKKLIGCADFLKE